MLGSKTVDERLDQARACLAPPEPDVLAATRALKPILGDTWPVSTRDIDTSVRAASVLAGYSLIGQQFMYWHERGNITFAQQHSPWEKHLRQQVADNHEAAARRAESTLRGCYGAGMFERMRYHQVIPASDYQNPGGGDAVILSCWASAKVLGSADHLDLLLYATPSTATGASLQAYVRDNDLTTSKPEYNAGPTVAGDVLRFCAYGALSIIGEL